MICDWCSAEIVDLGAHFASYAGKPCRIAALARQQESANRRSQRRARQRVVQYHRSRSPE